MNTRAISLPDLVTGRRKNTTLSLSEGFTGGHRKDALNCSSLNFVSRPLPKAAEIPWKGDDGSVKSSLGRVLPIYYRTRNLVQSTEQAGYRPTRQVVTELRSLERAVAKELRPLHPLLFQRLDDTQMDRFIRAMPFMKLSQGRWIFGADNLAEEWPTDRGGQSFILLYGVVSLYQDPTGVGDKQEISRGTVFCPENHFHIVDEFFRDIVCGAAHCDEPCIVGIIDSRVLSVAYNDRQFGNRRIEQTMKMVPSFSRITKPDSNGKQDDRGSDRADSAPASRGRGFSASAIGSPSARSSFSSTSGSRALAAPPVDETPGAVVSALRELSKVATAVHVQPGRELLSQESLDDCVLIIAKGGLEVRGDCLLTERLDAIPPKRVRVRVKVERAEKLAGDSIFDKLDPYVIVKLGDFKRFQTPVEQNAGVNPTFDYNGCLTYAQEETMEFSVWDKDTYSADDLCGNGSLPIASLEDGWSGWVDLTRPKQGMFRAEEALEEPAGGLKVTINWDYEKVSALTKEPKKKLYPDQELFSLKQFDVWGHEHMMIGEQFRRTLESAGNTERYALTLGDFRLIGSAPKGAAVTTTCWKVSRQRFLEFTKTSGREKQFIQACRLSSLEKQSKVKTLLKRLIGRWDQEVLSNLLRTGGVDEKPVEEAMDPSRFRIAYRGVKARIFVRNALNLSGAGLFDKADPYVVVNFRGSDRNFRTKILMDAGSDPIWDAEGSILYNGETAMDIAVYDWDKYSAHDLLGHGVLQVEQFCGGFEGMVHLAKPGKQKKNMKPSSIVIGVQWDPPLNPNLTGTGTMTSLKALVASAGAAAASTA